MKVINDLWVWSETKQEATHVWEKCLLDESVCWLIGKIVK